jgi:IS5 family transposase
MLRMYLMQNWFALSDPAREEALYEIASLRTFAGLGLEAIPDETTILNFRHLLEANDLAEDIFKQVNAHLARKGLPLKRGSIVDATITCIGATPRHDTGPRLQLPSGSDDRSIRVRNWRATGLSSQTTALPSSTAWRP